MKCYICQNDFRLKELIEVEVEHRRSGKPEAAETETSAPGKTKEMICARCAEKKREESNQ